MLRYRNIGVFAASLVLAALSLTAASDWLLRTPIVRSYPHDRQAFTQGLAFHDGFLYEGTGLYGRSELRRVEIETGKVLQRHKLPDGVFGEGITIFHDRILQLTWQSHTGFVYDRNRFDLLTTFTYPTEGWGLTHDGKRLIMSDGSATLHFLDPQTFKKIGQIQITDGVRLVTNLNELEYVNGEILANVWKTERIARISPQTGEVIGWIDLIGLSNLNDPGEPIDVLNGIAYDSVRNRLFVTGKLWPRVFEIQWQ